MLRWTMKSLVTEKGFAASLLGIAAALVVGLLVDAAFRGEAERIVVYPERAGADVWVMQEGVENMHMAASLIRRSLMAEIAEWPGVAQVGAILYRNGFVVVGGEPWFTYLVARLPGSSLGGAWEVSAGSADPGPGQVVLSEVLARRAGVGIGGPAQVQGRELEVVGLTRGTWSMANTVTFVSWEDLAAAMSAPGSASYLLVRAEDGVVAGELTASLREAYPEYSILPSEEFVDNDYEMASQMGTELIQIMRLVASLAAGLVVAFTTFAATARRSREIAVLRAIGIPDWRLYAASVGQATMLVVSGLGTSVLLLAAGRPVIESLAPEISLSVRASGVLSLGAVAVGVGVLAAVVPIRRIADIDPAVAFREGAA